MIFRLLKLLTGSRAFLDEVYDDWLEEEVKEVVEKAEDITKVPLDNYSVETSYAAILIIIFLAAVVITAIVLIVRVVLKNRSDRGAEPEIIEEGTDQDDKKQDQE